MNKAINLYMVYQFIKRLATPFMEWDAFKTGVINDKGEIVTPSLTRTFEQNKSFTKFDLLVLKLKKLLMKLPGGTTKFASYMAALWLIKEHNHFTESSVITENFQEIDINRSLKSFHQWYHYYTEGFQEGNIIIEDEGGAPTVNVGSGNIAGLGVGPQGEPGLTKAQQRRHRKRAVDTLLDPSTGRKSFATFLEDNSTDSISNQGRKLKRHPRPSTRVA